MVNWPHDQYMTKETRIHNGERALSSINSAGEAGQLHVKEWN